MKLTDLVIPPQFRVAAWAAGIAIVLAIGGFGGWKIASWQAGAERAVLVEAHGKVVAGLNDDIKGLNTEIRVLNDNVAELEAAIAAQNAATERLAAERDAALRARKTAEEMAARAAKSSMGRVQVVKLIRAADCAPVLNKYWELRK